MFLDPSCGPVKWIRSRLCSKGTRVIKSLHIQEQRSITVNNVTIKIVSSKNSITSDICFHVESFSKAPVSTSISFCFSRTTCIAAFGTRKCARKSWGVSPVQRFLSSPITACSSMGTEVISPKGPTYGRSKSSFCRRGGRRPSATTPTELSRVGALQSHRTRSPFDLATLKSISNWLYGTHFKSCCQCCKPS